MSIITSLSGVGYNDSKDAMKELLIFEGRLAMVGGLLPLIKITVFRYKVLGPKQTREKVVDSYVYSTTISARWSFSNTKDQNDR